MAVATYPVHKVQPFVVPAVSVEFLIHLKDLTDKELLKLHDRLALKHLKAVVGPSYRVEKEAELALYETYREIQLRVAAGTWQPHAPRKKSEW